MRRLIPVFIVALMLTAGTKAPVAAQSAADPPLLTVSATASVRAVPDRAVLQLGVETEAATAQAAMADNSTRMANVVAALQQVGISPSNMQTSSISLTPVYVHNNGQPPRLVGYRASNTVTAELTDLTRVGAAIDAAVMAGANQVQGVSFGLSNELSYRERALTMAGQTAVFKARALAVGLGITLGAVFSAQEVGYQVTPVNERAGAVDAGTPVLPGELVIQSTVQVQFRIGA
jgi:uncharacterized protein YggE